MLSWQCKICIDEHSRKNFPVQKIQKTTVLQCAIDDVYYFDLYYNNFKKCLEELGESLWGFFLLFLKPNNRTTLICAKSEWAHRQCLNDLKNRTFNVMGIIVQNVISYVLKLH